MYILVASMIEKKDDDKSTQAKKSVKIMDIKELNEDENPMSKNSLSQDIIQINRKKMMEKMTKKKSDKQ